MRIDFYLYNLHEVLVWLPIWRGLRAEGVDARFVLEPPGVHTAQGSVPDAAQGWRDDKGGDLLPLMTQEAFERIGAYLRARGIEPLAEGRYDTADAVVSTQGIGWLWRYSGLKLKTAYGCAANRDIYGHSEMNVGLDGVFVHGEYGRACIARHVPEEWVVVTGFPKYAAFFRGEVDRRCARARFGLDSQRPVVAYFSTWAHNGSIERFAGAVASLAEDCDVVYKPHHNNLHFERERLRRLEEMPGVRVDPSEPCIVPYLAAADLVLADVRSGALTEAFLTDRPAIGLSASGDLEKDGLLEGTLEAAPVCLDPRSLRDVVARMLERDDLAEARRRLSDRLFTRFDGRDDEVTARAMVERVSAG